MKFNVALSLISFFFYASALFAQSFSIEKAEPPNWWAGMKHNEIELLVYGENLDSVNAFSASENFRVTNVIPSFSGDYLFVTVNLSENIKPGNYPIFFVGGEDTLTLDYPVSEREFAPESHAGFSEKDIVYLVTPDRFANGDENNDTVFVNQLNRSDGLARHGGDIAGIIRHLDYIAELGATAIWINPLLENNMPISYHGYAATDLYKIDPRFGTAELYKTLVRKAHERRLKIIYDHVSNHVGINHAWVEKPPCKDWFHGTPKKHLSAMHEKMALFDVHADSGVVKRVLNGWFVNEMPDLNQKNPHLARYLIQNAIWWIEFAGIDGIREDTYAYVDQDFLSRFIVALKNEYPNINIVGEVWTGEPEFLAPYLKGNKFGNGKAELNIVTDFAFRDALAEYLNAGKVYQIYNTFCKDFIYAKENKLLTFLDNHDTERPMFIARNNAEKVKSAFAVLLTTRGIPQILYGDEIGLYGGKDHGAIRCDFPGGWRGDERNAFLPEGRTETENEIYNCVKRLILLRKNNPALSEGKTVHFPPRRNVYAYIRQKDGERFLILINGNDFPVRPDFELIKKYFARNVRFFDVSERKTFSVSEIELSPFGFKILRVR